MRYYSRAAAWLIVLAVLTTYSWKMGGFVAWFLLCTCGLLLSYSLVSSIAGLRFCHIKRSIERKQYLSGETMVVHVDIECASWLPIPWMLYKDKYCIQLIKPKRRKPLRLTYHVSKLQRGVYEEAAVQIVLGDLFGLFGRKYSIPSELEFTVYPSPLFIQQLHKNPSNSIFSTCKTNRKIYEELNTGLRPYVIGDPRHRIHWKVSAKRNEWMVKESGAQDQQLIVLGLDAAAQHYEANASLFELGISYAAGLLKHIQKDPNQRLQFFTSQDEQVWNLQSSPVHIQSMLDQLAKLTLKNSYSNTLLFQHVQRIQPGATFLYLTPQLSEETVYTLMRLQNNKTRVIIVELTSSSDLVRTTSIWKPSIESLGYQHTYLGPSIQDQVEEVEVMYVGA